MKRIVKDMFTEGDGESFEPVAILGAIALAAAIGFQAHAIFIKNAPFDMFNFSGGVAAILAGIGGGTYMRPQVRPLPRYSASHGSTTGPQPKTPDLDD